MSASRRLRRKFQRRDPVFAAELIETIRRCDAEKPDQFVGFTSVYWSRFTADVARSVFRLLYGEVPDGLVS